MVKMFVTVFPSLLYWFSSKPMLELFAAMLPPHLARVVQENVLVPPDFWYRTHFADRIECVEPAGSETLEARSIQRNQS